MLKILGAFPGCWRGLRNIFSSTGKSFHCHFHFHFSFIHSFIKISNLLTKRMEKWQIKWHFFCLGKIGAKTRNPTILQKKRKENTNKKTQKSEFCQKSKIAKKIQKMCLFSPWCMCSGDVWEADLIFLSRRQKKNKSWPAAPDTLKTNNVVIHSAWDGCL